MIALASGGVYRVTHRRLQPSAFLEIRELSFGIGEGCVLALAIGSLLHVLFATSEPYATQLVTAVIVTVATITVGRMLLRSFLHALTTTRVLVVGAGTTADRIMLSVRQDAGMTLVGRIVDHKSDSDGDSGLTDTIGRTADLPRLCRQLDVHRVLVAAQDEFSVETMNIYRQLQDFVHIAMVPRYYELISWRSSLTDLAGHALPRDRATPPQHLGQVHEAGLRPVHQYGRAGPHLPAPPRGGPRRQVELPRSGVLPPDPPRARRRAVHGHQVPLHDDGHGGPARLSPPENTEDHVPEDFDRPLHEVRRKMDESVRITRFGAFLRRTGIDEIPQFINVFKGDMSVVGPRPFIPSESNVEGWATRRFDVRPGITGLWQVSGRNDLTRNDLVQLDYLYVASWSLWWDLKIMFETPRTMARGIGAY